MTTEKVLRIHSWHCICRDRVLCVYTTRFSSRRRTKLHVFLRYCFMENTQLSPSLTQKPVSKFDVSNHNSGISLTIKIFLLSPRNCRQLRLQSRHRGRASNQSTNPKSLIPRPRGNNPPLATIFCISEWGMSARSRFALSNVK